MFRKVILTLCASTLFGAMGTATTGAFPFGPPPLPALGGPPRLGPGGALPHFSPTGPAPHAAIAGPAPHARSVAPHAGLAGSRSFAAGHLHAGHPGYGYAARYAHGYSHRYDYRYRDWARRGAGVSGNENDGSAADDSDCGTYIGNSRRAVICDRAE